eukprot:1452106-Rhodomonas_salina.4
MRRLTAPYAVSVPHIEWHRRCFSTGHRIGTANDIRYFSTAHHLADTTTSHSIRYIRTGQRVAHA